MLCTLFNYWFFFLIYAFYLCVILFVIFLLQYTKTLLFTAQLLFFWLYEDEKGDRIIKAFKSISSFFGM